MRVDSARVAQAIRLAEPVGEQHDGLLAAFGGLGEDAERLLERAHVLGEAGVSAEAQRQERADELHVVRCQQLADLAAAAEVARRAELAARVAGVRHRLDQRRPVREPRPADGDLEDAVGDGRRCDAQGHGAILARWRFASFQ